jgi:hypothetical protein
MKLYVDDIRSVPDESWMLAKSVTDAVRAIAQFHSSNPVGAKAIQDILQDYHVLSTATLSRPANRLELEV